jgi:hypothetical protein
MPRPLYPQEKNPWYPLDVRLVGPQILFGRGSEEKNSQPLPRLEPPIIQPVGEDIKYAEQQLEYDLS